MSTITLYRPDSKIDTYERAAVTNLDDGVLRFQAHSDKSNPTKLMAYRTNLPFFVED